MGSLSAGEGMGFPSLEKFGFPRSTGAGLALGPAKWSGCKGKKLCCGETAGDGGTRGHCLGVQPLQAGAMTGQRRVRLLPRNILGSPPAPVSSSGQGSSFCPTLQPCPGDDAEWAERARAQLVLSCPSTQGCNHRVTAGLGHGGGKRGEFSLGGGGCGSQGGSRHTSEEEEEEQRCLSHARAALASTRLVTGKSQPRSALPSVKWILAAPPLKQSRHSGAMAGTLSHGSPASSAPCESGPSRAGAGCPRTAHVRLAGHSRASTSPLRSPSCAAACSAGGPARMVPNSGSLDRVGMAVTSPPASPGSACHVHVKEEERV